MTAKNPCNGGASVKTLRHLHTHTHILKKYLNFFKSNVISISSFATNIFTPDTECQAAIRHSQTNYHSTYSEVKT